MLEKTLFPTLLQVCQPRHCPSIHPLIKVILKERASYQPLHCSNAAPPGRPPENGRSALPAVGVQRLQQDPEWPGCSGLHGTEVMCERKHLARYSAAEIKPVLDLVWSQIEMWAFCPRNWSPLPSTCWTGSLHWRHRTTRRTLNCCSGKMWGLYARWPKATATTGP